jgi:hypothetical protein
MLPAAAESFSHPKRSNCAASIGIVDVSIRKMRLFCVRASGYHSAVLLEGRWRGASGKRFLRTSADSPMHYCWKLLYPNLFCPIPVPAEGTPKPYLIVSRRAKEREEVCAYMSFGGGPFVCMAARQGPSCLADAWCCCRFPQNSVCSMV